MVEIIMATKMHSPDGAVFITVAGQLTARRKMRDRRYTGNSPGVDYRPRPLDPSRASKSVSPLANPQSSPTSGKKRRCRPPLRMTPKAQRRRWFREHNRRMRALALRTMCKEGRHDRTQ